LFLGFGYKVNVRFNFRSWQTQADMKVSSTILFHVSLFNRAIVEKELLQITNMEHIFSAKPVKRGNCPVAPPGCEHIFSTKFLKREQLIGCLLVACLVTLQLFQICFPRIFVVIPVCFLVFSAVMFLQI